jgi:beta-galactosidase
VLYASDYGYDHGFVWGSDAQDPVRGIMNAAGLFGSGSGWDLPGYPDGSWENVTLPDSWSARGIPPGIGWYRTTFSLHRPADSYVPIDVQVGGPGRGADSVHGNGGLQGAHLCQRLADRTGT